MLATTMSTKKLIARKLFYKLLEPLFFHSGIPMNPKTPIALASENTLFCAVIFLITDAYHSSAAYPDASYAPPHSPAAYPPAHCPLLTNSTHFRR